MTETREEIISNINDLYQEIEQLYNVPLVMLDMMLILEKLKKVVKLSRNINMELKPIFDQYVDENNGFILNDLNVMIKMPHFLSNLARSLNTTSPDWRKVMKILHDGNVLSNSTLELSFFWSIGNCNCQLQQNLFNCNKYIFELQDANISGVNMNDIMNAFYLTQERHNINYMSSMNHCLPTFIEFIYYNDRISYFNNIFVILEENNLHIQYEKYNEDESDESDEDNEDDLTEYFTDDIIKLKNLFFVPYKQSNDFSEFSISDVIFDTDDQSNVIEPEINYSYHAPIYLYGSGNITNDAVYTYTPSTAFDTDLEYESDDEIDYIPPQQ